MSMIHGLRNPILQQYILELLLPIVGYYLLDWSFNSIGIYYLLDYSASNVSFVRKFLAINRHTENKVSTGVSFFVLGLMTVLSIGVMILTLYFLMKISSYELPILFHEISTAFFNELWFLLPILFVASFYSDKVTFFLPRLFLKYKADHYLWGELIVNSSFILLLAVFIYGSIYFSISKNLLIPLFLIGKIVFDLSIRSKVQKWCLNT